MRPASGDHRRPRGRRRCWPPPARRRRQPRPSPSRARRRWAPAASPASTSRSASRSAAWSTSTAARPACAAPPGPPSGSVANIAGLRDGSLDLAIVQSDAQAEAVAGSGAFAAAGPFADLRAVMALYPEPLTLVARADAGIARVEDLAGQARLASAPRARAPARSPTTLMAALGWTDASFARGPGDRRRGGRRRPLRGELDAFLYAVGHPALVIQEATTGCDARLVPIDGPAIDALVAARPELIEAGIPGGLYRGNPAAVATFGVGATLVTRADEPEDRLHAMLDRDLRRLRNAARPGAGARRRSTRGGWRRTASRPRCTRPPNATSANAAGSTEPRRAGSPGMRSSRAGRRAPAFPFTARVLCRPAASSCRRRPRAARRAAGACSSSARERSAPSSLPSPRARWGRTRRRSSRRRST